MKSKLKNQDVDKSKNPDLIWNEKGQKKEINFLFNLFFFVEHTKNKKRRKIDRCTLRKQDRLSMVKTCES